MRTTELDIDTRGREHVDLTDEIRKFCSGSGDGLLNVFVPHATAGLAIFELGAGTEDDVRAMLERLISKEFDYTHRHGSPGHGADHLLPTILSPSVVIPVVGGAPQLGTWQYVVLVDRNEDNPRRRVHLSFVEA
jgi:secondary thiamine-phosphate synthase enzyme